jgi:flagellar motor switch/type III secretory pathway protein FliN
MTYESVRWPRISGRQVHLSTSLAAWPGEFCAALDTSVVDVLKLCSEKVSLTRIDWREVGAQTFDASPGQAEEQEEQKEQGRLSACLELEPRAASVVVEMSAELAHSLADLLLGGDGRFPQRLRDLSPAESALIEFLFLRSVQEINARLGDPVLSLTRVGSWEPTLPACDRGVLATFRLEVGGTVGAVTVWIRPGEAFLSLTPQDVAALFRGKCRSGPPDRQIGPYLRVAPQVRLSAVLGEVDLTVGELAELEVGDLVIIGRSAVRFQEGRLSGLMQVRAGDGRNVFLAGQVEERLYLGLQIETISIEEEAVNGRQLTMSDGMLNGDGKTAMASTENFGEALDQLLLTVHVEIAARQLKLDELARLSVGQYLDLGCRVTDPVELLIDGRRIAHGELVDFEGRMGVIITQIAG